MSEITPPLIDIGVNLASKRLAQRATQVIQRAATSRVKGMILTGTSPEVSAQCAEYARTLSVTSDDPQASCKLWSTAGVHPHDAGRAYEQGGDWLTEIKQLLALPEVIAVGECGLDFERDYSPRDVQLKVFEMQLELAAQAQLPLFLHQRGAHDAFCDLLERYAPQLARRGTKLAAVVHCFTGDRRELERYLELGCLIGITGWVCDERRGGALREAVTSLPLDRVLVETDAPYLLPRTLRPKPKNGTNEPAFLPHIVEELARYMSVDAHTLSLHATRNTRELFEITLASPEPPEATLS